MGIKEKIAEIRERKAEEAAVRKREERLAQLEKSSIAKELEYHPVLMNELPTYAEKIDDYILRKARTDLRESQFNKDAPVKDILDMMEIGGVLEWKETKNAVNELSYNKPICCDEKVYDNPVEMNLEYLLNNGTDISAYENLIGWHSQTLGTGEITEGDVKNMIDLKTRVGEKQYYHVIYSTTTNQFFWYALEKNKETPPEDFGF